MNVSTYPSIFLYMSFYLLYMHWSDLYLCVVIHASLHGKEIHLKSKTSDI